MNNDSKIVITITIEGGKVDIQSTNGDNFATQENYRDSLEEYNQCQIENQNENEEESTETNQLDYNRSSERRTPYEESRGGRSVVGTANNTVGLEKGMALRNQGDWIVDLHGNKLQIGHLDVWLTSSKAQSLYWKYNELNNEQFTGRWFRLGTGNFNRYFENADLSRTSITKLKLRSGDNKHFNARRIRFNNSMLHQLDFENVDLTDSTFINTKISDSVFVACAFNGTNFNNANIQSVSNMLCNFDKSSFENAVVGASFLGCTMTNMNLRGTDLKKSTLHVSNLTGSDLTGAKLTASTLLACNLNYTTLTNCDLRDIDCNGTTFVGANLTGALYNAKTKNLNVTPEQRAKMIYRD